MKSRKIRKVLKVKAVEVKNYQLKALPPDYPWQILHSLLDDLSHVLPGSFLREARGIVRNRDVNGILGLADSHGLQSMSHCADSTLAVKRAVYQVAALLKKFQFPTNKSNRKAEALLKFLKAEENCKQYNAHGYRRLVDSRVLWQKTALAHMKDFLVRLLGSEMPPSADIVNWSRHGPGANLDTKEGFIAKYDKYCNWPYSCTVDATKYGQYIIGSDARWTAALLDSYRQRKNIPMHMPIDMREFWKTVIMPVHNARITFVPKNALTERTIAIEPTLNLLLQLGVDGFIRKRLKFWGVDIDSQCKNQELARTGSVEWRTRDPFITLDLAAASDSISLALCREVLPPVWYRFLCDLRTPSGLIGEDLIVNFEKISSMGNGFTFALETALFTAMVYAVEKVVWGKYDASQHAVFGDDIIIRRSLYGHFRVLLYACGFALNTDKSFISGPVRESCGADWLQGEPIRPVHLTKQPETVMDLYGDYNRLKRILSLNWGCEESTALVKILKWIPETFRSIRGPLSDTEFTSFLHDELPQGTLRGWIVYHPALVVQIRKLACRSFLLGRLAHNLKVCSPVKPRIYPWQPGDVQMVGVEDSGSRFTRYARNRVRVVLTTSACQHWQADYNR